MEELLKKFKVDRNTLTSDELITLEKWSKALSIQKLSVPEIREYLGTMIEGLERELTGHDNPPMTFANLVFRGRRERHLKARLQNYIMLRDFLTAPERAQAYIEKQLGGFTGT